MSHSFQALGVSAPRSSARRRRHRRALRHPDPRPPGRAGRPRHPRRVTDRLRQDVRLRPPGRRADRRAAAAPRALVLVPTRELALQVAADSRRSPRRRTSASQPSTAARRSQPRPSRRAGAHVLVATPGRLHDLMERAPSRSRDVRILVLDEADRMLDMGFRPQVDRILRRVPGTGRRCSSRRRSTARVAELARAYTVNADARTGAPPPRPRAARSSTVRRGHAEDKLDRLVEQLGAERGLTLVFVRTKHGADKLARKLERSTDPAVAMHGNLSQNRASGRSRSSSRPRHDARRHRRRRPRPRRRRHHARDQLRPAARTTTTTSTASAARAARAAAAPASRSCCPSSAATWQPRRAASATAPGSPPPACRSRRRRGRPAREPAGDGGPRRVPAGGVDLARRARRYGAHRCRRSRCSSLSSGCRSTPPATPKRTIARSWTSGGRARERGHYALAEFLTVCRWKTPRSGPLVVLNSVDSVEASTSVALRETSSERERAEALLSLRGVGWPTASVLLHLAYPERYPILDVRALHALGVAAPSPRTAFASGSPTSAHVCDWPCRPAWTGAPRPSPLAVVKGAGRAPLVTPKSALEACWAPSELIRSGD